MGNKGGPIGLASLEANGALVAESEDSASLTLWVGYDSYHPGELRGELGWLRLVVDKSDGRIRDWMRHPDNPLPFLANDECCARCGGNLDNDLRICGRHAFFYYARKNRSDIEIKLALSNDPLFRTTDWVGHFDGPLGDEEVVEKFQAFQTGELLCLLYESRHVSGIWRTGLRTYLIGSIQPLCLETSGASASVRQADMERLAPRSSVSKVC